MWWHARRNGISSRTSRFKSAGASVQSNTGSRGVRVNDSNAGYTTFRGSVKSTGYPLHSPVSPFISLPVCHRVPSHFNWNLLLQSYLFTANCVGFCAKVTLSRIFAENVSAGINYITFKGRITLYGQMPINVTHRTSTSTTNNTFNMDQKCQ